MAMSVNSAKVSEKLEKGQSQGKVRERSGNFISGKFDWLPQTVLGSSYNLFFYSYSNSFVILWFMENLD